MIEAVLTGLIDKVNELTESVHNDFYLSIGGRIYDNEAPPQATFPYCVIHTLPFAKNWTFSEEYVKGMFQINIFSKKSANTEIDDIYSKLEALIEPAVGANWITLSLTGYTQVSLIPTFVERFKDEDDNWQYTIQYEIEIGKD